MLPLRRLRILLPCAIAACVAATAQPLAQGKLLVATPKVRDADFSKAVVLVVWVNRDAVLGLVVNRPLNGRTVSEVAPLAGNQKDPLWRGGPVPLGTSALINAAPAPPRAKRLLPDLYLISDAAFIARSKLPQRFRIYVGTCGWTMEQLETELRAGYWRVLPGRASLVFDSHPETLWDRLVDSFEGIAGGGHPVGVEARYRAQSAGK